MSGSNRNSKVESLIDNNLRKIFEEELDRDLPDRLQQLVDELGDMSGETQGEESDETEKPSRGRRGLGAGSARAASTRVTL